MEVTKIGPNGWWIDHFSTMLYIETVVVDGGGRVEPNRMRTSFENDNHWMYQQARQRHTGEKEYPTRHLFQDERRKTSALSFKHDDWSCLDDFAREGYLDDPHREMGWLGPIVLTDKGWDLAHQIRRMRGLGHNLKDLEFRGGKVRVLDYNPDDFS